MRTAFCRGRHHDFALYKRNRQPIPSSVTINGDLGYVGITAIHSSAITPHKSSKLIKLTKEQKEENKQRRQVRIKIEHFFSFIKRFRIFTTSYRNRRKRFMLRFNLFAAICNKEISSL